MKMGKKVKEYKAGDFIFAKVKGYPAWPARVQRLNGKKYFVYFYGTGEIANLPPNMIFDYAENKDKFLTKTVKRRDFNDGVKQIEHDFANNVPLEEVVGTVAEVPADASINETLNDSANETLNDSAFGDTSADETHNDKGKKPLPKTPAKETPKAKELKTPRGRAKKDEAKEDKDDEKKEAEIISRSGRKIRPKRYIDEQTDENATLPSPAAKKRRGQTPEKEKESTVEEKRREKGDKNNKLYNTIPQSELEDLKAPTIAAAATEKENILIAYLPTGVYVGVKLFQSPPTHFKTDSVKLQWYKQQASNALTLKLQLERGQITSQSIASQLVTDLNLTDEEKATLDKERETEEKKSRVQFLKTEMKLIELDAKIKTCLCLEKADTESCLKLLDDLMELNLKPLMLLKHPTCVETVKRMRAYVGNTPCWGLSETDALQFNKHAQSIRKQADTLYNNMKILFYVTDGLSFWEYFSERVLQFKMATAKLNADELLEMVHEPIEMSQPSSHTMKSAIEAANEEEKSDDKRSEEPPSKRKTTPAKRKKDAAATNSTPTKSLKRQSSRNKQSEKEPEPTKDAEPQNGDETVDSPNKDTEVAKEKSADKPKEKTTDKSAEDSTEATKKDNEKEPETNENKETADENDKMPEKNDETPEKSDKTAEKNDKTAESNAKTTENNDKPKDNNDKPTENNDASEQSDKTTTENDKAEADSDKMEVDGNKEGEIETEKKTENKDKEENENSIENDKKSNKEAEKQNKVAEKQKKPAEKPQEKDDAENDDKNDNETNSNDKDKDSDEPKAKRSRESKKTEAPPSRSPAKRKSKV